MKVLLHVSVYLYNLQAVLYFYFARVTKIIKIVQLNKFFFFFQWRYSPGWASASFKSFLHPFRFRAATVQFLRPSFATSSFTPSSQRNLGLPVARFPPDSLRRTLLAKPSSSWRMTCPAHLSLLSLQNFTMSYHTIDKVLD